MWISGTGIRQNPVIKMAAEATINNIYNPITRSKRTEATAFARYWRCSWASITALTRSPPTIPNGARLKRYPQKPMRMASAKRQGMSRARTRYHQRTNVRTTAAAEKAQAQKSIHQSLGSSTRLVKTSTLLGPRVRVAFHIK